MSFYATPIDAPAMAKTLVVRRRLEACAFVCLLTVNWLLAAQAPSLVFACTSLVLFAWAVLLLIRWAPQAAVLALPFVITRAATMVSLAFIEAGAYMPEVGRVGAPGDASASFAAFSALFFLVFALIFGALEQAALASARSPLLARAVALLRAPIVLLCAAAGALAFVKGLHTGFPAFQHIDRFYYRRFYGEGIVLLLLDNKFIIGAILGAIAFDGAAPRLIRAAATAVQVGFLLLFFLFGDKFFTLLVMATYFLTPYLLQRDHLLLRTMARGSVFAALLLTTAFAATLYVYSDYGSASLGDSVEKLGERIAGQGELWFVASQDDRKLFAYDPNLVRSYAASLNAPDPAGADFINGVETFYFIDRYTPQPLRRSFQRNEGWVQLTMGSEALALAGFGYGGVVALTVAGGALAGLAALYLRRAFASGFPLSIGFAVWTSLQVYMWLQQAALWAVFARGQVRRFLLFLILEVVLFAINRGQRPGAASRASNSNFVPSRAG